MYKQSEETRRPRSAGDAAVDGLLGGLLGGALMAAYLAAAGLANGESVAASLGRFDPGGNGVPMAGVLAHLAVSSVYGAIYGLLFGLLRRAWPRLPGWLAGLAYGALLVGLANGLVLPQAAPALAQFSPPHFVVAHLIFGLTAGLIAGRR